MTPHDLSPHHISSCHLVDLGWHHSRGSDREHSSAVLSSSLRCLLSRPALFFKTQRNVFDVLQSGKFDYQWSLFLPLQVNVGGRLWTRQKKKVPSACLRKFSSSCSQLVLYGHIFRCTHEREASSRCAADWFYHYVRTLRRSTPVFLPKMFKLGAYCTFLFKARFKLWYNDDRMRYAIAIVVWSISNYHILREKWYLVYEMMVCGRTRLCDTFFFEVLCQTFPFTGRKKRFLVLPPARMWRCSDSCSCTARHQRAPVLRSGLTQIRHIQGHALNTHDMLRLQKTHIRPCLQTRQYIAGVISRKMDNTWVHGRNYQHFA